jgi:DNA-binding transcriptional MerR regulator
MAAEPKLGSKIFYKIGEVSELTKLPAYVLRFWESQFNFLKPRKSRGQQRLYVQSDIEKVLEIKRMLYEEGYTIPGVKRVWSRRARQGSRPMPPREVAERVRGDLIAALRILASYDGR